MSTRILLIAALLCLASLPAHAYQAALEASASKDKVHRGESFTYTVKVIEEGEPSLMAAFRPPEFGPFRVSGSFASSEAQVARDKARRVTTHEFRLSSDTPGPHVIPPAALVLTDMKTGAAQELTSDEVRVEVLPEKEGVVQGLAEDIRDIKEPKGFMDRVKLYFYGIVALLLIALLILVGFAWYMVAKKRRTGPAPTAPGAPGLSHREAAQAAIRAADAYRADPKRYYTAVSDAVRGYLAAARGLHAMEATTAELVETCRDAGLPADAVMRLEGFFTEADLVKFAKLAPDEADKDRFAEAARALVGAI